MNICCAKCSEGIAQKELKKARKGDESKAVIRGPDCYHASCFAYVRGRRDRQFGGHHAAQ